MRKAIASRNLENQMEINTSQHKSTSTVDTLSQTPIEIALGIDENGMTLASTLYNFLELNPSHFARWCKRNIVDNSFSAKNTDYIQFTINGENSKVGGRPKLDYKLTANFAKKLSMTGNTERHEQARNYFIACEQGLKVATEKIRESGNINNKFISDSLKKIVTLLENQESRIAKLEENQQMESALIQPTRIKPYNPWIKKMIPKYALLESYFDINRGALYRNILNEMENIYGIDTQQIQADFLYENNLTSCYPLEPYEYNPKYRDMVEQVVNSNLIKFGIASEDDPITSTKHITIFDASVRE